MWAVRRSLGAFSRSGVRGISGYGSALRYAADSVAETAAVGAASEEDKFQRMSAQSKDLLGRLKKCFRKKGNLDLDEDMKGYKGPVHMDALELLLRRAESRKAMPVYEWGKPREGFVYTPGFVINLISRLRLAKRLDQIEQIVSELSGKADPEVEEIARSMLYMGYLKNKDSENAERVMAEMREKGQQLKPRAMLELMMISHEEGGPDGMLAAYKEHAANGLVPDSHGYNRMIVVLCAEERAEDAFQVFKESAEKGAEHKENTYMTLIAKLVRMNKIEEARQVAELLMKSREIKSDMGAFKQLMIKLAEQKSYDEAFKLLKPLVRQARYCYAATQLMEVLIKDNEWDKAMELVELMKEQGVRVESAFSLLITNLCKEKRSSDAKKVFDAMVELGLAPDAEACSALALCASNSQSE